jgi:hypothetical protein
MTQSDPVARFVDLDELCERREDWRWLANHALEANPFYGPDLMIPALKAGIAGTATRLLIVEQNGKLRGLFPLQRPFFKDGAMSLGWTLYRDPFTCLTVPLVAGDGAEAVVATGSGLSASARKQVLRSPADAPRRARATPDAFSRKLGKASHRTRKRDGSEDPDRDREEAP